MIDMLRKWCQNNDAINRTEEMFWKCFEEYSNDDSEEYQTVFTAGKENITLKLDKISCEIDLPEFSQGLIAIYIDICCGEVGVGWYKQLFTLDGELFDEYFVIE